MPQKVFMTKGELRLHGDERDQVVPSKLRKHVYEWCVRNGVVADMPLSRDGVYISEKYFGVDLWRIKDDQQRMLFVLRWS